MEYLVPKATSDTVAYYIDWSKQLTEGDAIANFTLTVSSGTVSIVQPVENFGTFLRALVEGGASGETATLACTVYTVGQQVLSRDIQLYVSDSAEAITPSTATKRTICAMVFEEVGLAGYEFDATPEEYASMMRRLDTQMAQWSTVYTVPYNAPPQIGGGDLDDESGVPDDALDAVVLTIAKRFAPLIGKKLSAESLTALTQAMGILGGRYSLNAQRPIPYGTPMGAGNKPWGIWWPYGFNGPSFPSRRC